MHPFHQFSRPSSEPLHDHDKTLWIWDAATGAALQTLKGHTDEGCGVAFSPRFRRLGRKRKRDEGFVDGSGGMKRSKSGDSRIDVVIATDAEKAEPEVTGLHSIQEPEPDSLAGCESETYGNQIHCCLVVSPAGPPLHAYRLTRELLEELRDAIRGHKSLLEDGKFLHQDISENNIIIIEAASKGEPKGRLINLDLAKELDSVPSRDSHRTGTMQFMAIEVL
ncbi:hypothetical protein VE03_08552 [Pseudogymnoascus sp. 23342-1-I1]|nr:hypothetical protein VE03_08552 [Pseudogymnoascus sp. 23342-1-I1]